MAQQSRQSRLFAAEDYTAVYESYVNANFQAYDFDTIRDSMTDYIRTNYPENYNDWVESAEFVSLLDVIAMFGHNLAFRIDLNSRNNFLSTAERQDSVFKLAEFLGYQPRRNVTSFGNLKIVSVKTNEDIIGSEGTSLGGLEVRYDNTTGEDNIDNFVSIMNGIFNISNQFGSPTQRSTINGVLHDFYGLNNVGDQISFSFNGLAQGETVDFNAVNIKLDTTTKTIVERDPNPNGSFSIVYQNDGAGISSNSTGFFFGFKQGQLAFKDFLVDEPLSGMTLDIDVTDINQTDVWVQTVNTDGSIAKLWTKVDNAYGHNAIYNYIDRSVRDIYAVKTRENNQISIQFADESFGNLPRGIVRVWYRSSLNSSYVLRPDDIGTGRINVNYIGYDGNVYIATFGVQLKTNITNASAGESLDDIKTNAPRIYAAQDRMITADDYNSYLYTQSDNIKKIKSTNRTHSGHSRYIELRDPTGAYTNLNLFGTDGTLSQETRTKVVYATDRTPQSVFDKIIKPAILDDELINLYYSDKFKQTFQSEIADKYAQEDGWIELIAGATRTSPIVITTFSTHGLRNQDAIIISNVSSMTQLNSSNNYYVKKLTSNQFELYSDSALTVPVDGSGYTQWSPLYAGGFDGKITADALKYTWQQVGTTSTGYINNPDQEIRRIGETQAGFLKYLRVGSLVQFKTPTKEYKWAKISKSFAYGIGVDGADGRPTGLTPDSNYGAISLDAVIPNNSVIEFVYPAYSRQFSVAERTAIINFLEAKQAFALKYDYHNNGWDIIDRDPLPTGGTTSFPSAFSATGTTNSLGGSGSTHDNNWLIYIDYDSSSTVDKWNITQRTLRYKLQSNQIDFSNLTNEFTLNEKSSKKQRDSIRVTDVNNNRLPSSNFYVYGYEFVADGDKSGIYVNDTVILSMVDNNNDERPDEPSSFSNVVSSGDSLDKLRFEWTHVPADNELVDPSFTNLIDVHVLTKTYDTEFRSWLSSSRQDIRQPLVPTIDELTSSFKQQANRKAMSDSIIYKPVSYKVIFGSKADPEFQAKFRVIKVPESNYTDNEVKERVVQSITKFFDIENWDFGETFYFTELAAFVHKELVGIISSFVIVPQGANSVFGDLFQISPRGDELLIPNVSVNDVDLIDTRSSSAITQASA